MTQTKQIMLAGMLAFALLLMGAGNATAAVKCDFTRDLDLGIEGEDVRCLQQYLNSQGFIVATEGVGSLGKETTQFKELTQKAVMAWQTAHGVTPATGYFGSKSRAKYAALSSGTATPAPTTPTPTTPAPSSDSAEIALLKQQIASLTSRLDALERQIEQDEDEDEDEDEDDEESEAEEALEDAEDYFDEVWEEYEEADDAGENTGDAEDLLEEAEELFEEAEEAFDDEDWDEVMDLVEEIEELIEEAEDEL